MDDDDRVVNGDSGSAVTYKRTGNRHVVGVAISGNYSQAWFIQSRDIDQAFSRADVAFSHYWGTASGHRRPSSQTCDHGC